MKTKNETTFPEADIDPKTGLAHTPASVAKPLLSFSSADTPYSILVKQTGTSRILISVNSDPDLGAPATHEHRTIQLDSMERYRVKVEA